MALYSGRLLMRGGNESDFDPDKMIPREWAVSTDRKIVRICVSPGEVIRMATYDAFEEDMAKIENILKECQTIQEAVVRINTEVSQNADAVAEYTAQAKQYRDEAKQFRDEAFAATPEGYEDVVKNVEKNTIKIDTIIEKADLGIKNTASGEEIYLFDSANGKPPEFHLFGKARQQTTSGNQLLDDTNMRNVVLPDSFKKVPVVTNGAGSYTFSLKITGGTEQGMTISLRNANDKEIKIYAVRMGTPVTFELTEEEASQFKSITTFTFSGSAGATLDWIMLNKGATALPWEKFTGGQPSPSPEFPQEIEVSGASGSVEVRSAEKDLLNIKDKSGSDYGISYTVKDGVLTANGTATVNMAVQFNVELDKGEYFASGCPKGGSTSTYCIYVKKENTSGEIYGLDVGNGTTFSLTEKTNICCYARFASGYKVENLVFYPMIQLYKESTIPTPNGLAGIPVSSGGNYTDSNGQQWICDEIVKYADGSGERIQSIGKVVFDGSEDEEWVKDYVEKEAVFKSTLEGKKRVAGISNLYIHKNNMLSTDTNIGFNLSTSAENIRVRPEDYKTLTVEEWTTRLSENPMEVLYILAEPIRTQLTAEEISEIEKLSTFYPVTNISNDADCGMEVTYLCDSKNYIDSKIAELATAMVNNI